MSAGDDERSRDKELGGRRTRGAPKAPPVYQRYVRRGHGGSRGFTYEAWARLKRRFKGQYYAPWRDFEVFRRDVGRRPDKTALARLDEAKPWGPGNCWWRPIKRKDEG